MKKLLLIVMVMLSVAAISQPQLTWRFANPQLITGDTQLQFDVEVMGDAPGWYIYIAQLGITYNEAAFGSNIYSSGTVLVETGTLLNELYLGALGKYGIISQGDPFSNTLGVTAATSLESFLVTSGGLSHTEWPTAWTQIFIVTIDILDAGQPYDIDWWFNGMDGQQSCQTGFPLTVELCADPNFYEPWPNGSVVTDWTGANGDMWNDPLNWNNGVPTGDPTEEVNIDATTKAAPVIYGSAVTGTLNLIAGQLTIAPGGDLTTTGVFTNAGHLQMGNALGVSASFWPQAGLAGGGTFQYDRDVFCSGQVFNSVDPFGWHYIASPIAGFTTDDIPDYFVNAWNEGAAQFPWMHYGYDPLINPCTPWPTVTMGPLDAWSVNRDIDYPGPCPFPPGTGTTVEFGGAFTALNDSPTGYSLPATAAGGHPSVGWNFYGNPYAASLDPALFNWAGFDNGTWGAAMWSEDCTVSNYVYSGLGNGYANFVGPTQGFFMLTTGATTFALTGAERSHTSAASIYKDEVSNLLTLEATGDGTSDVTYIRFMEDMEAGNDIADFPKLFSTSEGLAQIYTTALGEKLAINALPETSVVPMGFTSVTTGEYTISAIETSDFANVVLEDLVTGEQTDLLTSSYTFSYTKNDDENRFLVHFTPLGIGNNAAASIDIWSNDHKIYVQAPQINGDIVVFNMMGQEVIRTDIEPGLNTIPVNDRNSYYVVKVVSDGVAKTGKVYVK